MLVCLLTGSTAWADTTVEMTTFSSISGYVDGDTNVSYAAAKGGAATNPAVNNGQIRVYQNGGTFTVSANNGCKIKSVTLGSAMGTTVTYSIDSGTASSNQSITANSTITVSDLDCSSVLFTCTGTSSSTRLYVNSLSVTYSSGTTPTIVASDPAALAYDDTSGSISYSISNGTGNVTAVSSESWLTIGTITSSTVPFTVTENTTGADRSATVTLSFTGASDKTVTVTQRRQLSNTETGNLNTSGVFSNYTDNGSISSDFTREGDIPLAAGDVHVVYAKGTGSNGYLNGTEIRVYAGNTLTFTAPTGYNITGITFTKGSSAGTISADQGAMTSALVWSGAVNSVVFSVSARTDLRTATVTVVAQGTAVDPTFSLNPNTNVNIGETVTVSSDNTDTSFSVSVSPSGIFTVGSYDSTEHTITLTAVGAGTATITATQAASTGYNAVTNASVGSITVDADATPAISPNSAQSLAVGATLNVTSDSPGALTVGSSDTNVATVSGSTITAVAEGTTTISITQAKATGYEAVSTPVTFTLTVTAAAATATATGNLNDSDTGVFSEYTDNGSISGDFTRTGTITTSAGNVNVEYAKGTGSNGYLKNDHIRVYAGNTLTFTAPTGYNITSITLTQGGNNTVGKNLTADPAGTWDSSTAFTSGSSKTWTGSSNSVVFTGETGSGNTALASATVTIQATGTPSEETTIYVTSDNDPYVYTSHSGTEYNGASPGAEATTTEVAYGVTWHKVTVPSNLFDVVLSSDSEGTNHTSTISDITSDTYFVYNYAGEIDNTHYFIVDPTATPVTATNVTTTVGSTVAAGVTNSNNLTLLYTSSNPSVATVDSSTGVVTGVAQGTATITVSWKSQGTQDGNGFLRGSTTYTATVNDVSGVDITENDEEIVYNFASNANWNFPGSKTTGTNTYTGVSTTTTSDTYKTITLYADGNGYNNYGAGLLIGKSGAYIQLPAYAFDVYGIVVEGLSTGSSNVKHNIFVGNEAISTEITGLKGTTSNFSIPEDYQDAGTIYKVQITSAHNAQIASITLKKKTSSTVIKPIATPLGGTYETAQTVELRSTGCDYIYYTLDGTDPKLSSTFVTGSPGTINITNSHTLRFIAKKGDEWSPEGVSQTYTIKPATPAINPAGGTFSSSTSAVLNCSTTGVSIIYTTDGTDPRTSETGTTATTLPASVTISTTSTLKAVSVDTYGNMSDVAEATFTITSSSLGTTEYQLVTDASQINTTSSYILVAPNGSSATAYYAMADQNSGYFNSEEVSVTSNICDIDGHATVTTFTLEAVNAESNVYALKISDGNYIASGTSGTTLTVDNGTTENKDQWTISAEGNGYILYSVGVSDRIIAINTSASNRFANYQYSNYKNFAGYLYVNTAGSVTAPIITPGTGIYTEAQTVTITAGTGATIYYTTDGSAPTSSSTEYTGSFTVNKTTTIKAIAYEGGVASSITTAQISFYVQRPVISPADGSSFSDDYTVTITSPQGNTIYYLLLDQKIYENEFGYPTDTNTGELNPAAKIYSGTLTFAQAMKVTAVCIDNDGNISEPTICSYTYTGAVRPNYHDEFYDGASGFTASSESSTYTTETGAPVWELNANTGEQAIAQWGEERYYERTRGTSANTTSSEITRWYGYAYFTSPIIDLTGTTDPYFNFVHAGHGFYTDPNTDGTTSTAYETTLSADRAKLSCNVQIGICDPSGNVSSWTTVDHDDYEMFDMLFKNGTTTSTGSTSRGGLFNRKQSGDIDLSSYVGNTIRIRFAYESRPQRYGSWNIDEFNVYASAEEEITMNQYGWTTYVVDHDIDAYETTQKYIVSGDQTVQIFKVTEFDHNTVVMQQLGFVENHDEASDDSERYIPSGTPVVIKGTANATIELEVSDYTGVIKTLENNLLKASMSPNTVTATDDVRLFILTVRSNWKAGDDPIFNRLKTGRTVPDHRGYMNGNDQVDEVTQTADPTSGRYRIGDNSNTTGITEITTNTTVQDGKWYNLQGIEVAHPSKGIYIHNGRKVIIK